MMLSSPSDWVAFLGGICVIACAVLLVWEMR
jgi:hypothetical protein